MKKNGHSSKSGQKTLKHSLLQKRVPLVRLTQALNQEDPGT